MDKCTCYQIAYGATKSCNWWDRWVRGETGSTFAAEVDLVIESTSTRQHEGIIKTRDHCALHVRQMVPVGVYPRLVLLFLYQRGLRMLGNVHMQQYVQSRTAAPLVV